MSTNSGLSPEALEKRAGEQRERIAESVTELKESLRETVRERLDVKHYARRHLGTLAGAAAVFAFATGYALAGIFTADEL